MGNMRRVKSAPARLETMANYDTEDKKKVSNVSNFVCAAPSVDHDDTNAAIQEALVDQSSYGLVYMIHNEIPSATFPGDYVLPIFTYSLINYMTEKNSRPPRRAICDAALKAFVAIVWHLISHILLTNASAFYHGWIAAAPPSDIIS